MTADIPPDDLGRTLIQVHPDDEGLTHLAMVGDAYTILVSGEQTGGAYTLIDMLVPPGGGPGPHRHDFEELFILSEGELTFHFRGTRSTARAGEVVTIPANAPHYFHNDSDAPARMLCLCTPAGQEEFFRQVGTPIPSRTAAPPQPTPEQMKTFLAKAAASAPAYATAFDVTAEATMKS